MNAAEITEDHVRAARRAYYGAISYVDDHMSRLIGLLRDTGRLDSTVVIVTSDHGEMLGERGAWYKMSFFEGAARVPLIVRAPALFPPGRVPSAVSTMDLLPTLVARDEVTAEYLAEGAIAPIVMIRRGRHKFIHSPADPDQLFDLASDPHERVNLAGVSSSAERAGQFLREVAARWDLTTLDREVRHSQQRRIAVSDALRTGAQAPWDFTPAYDASRRYIRNHRDLADLETMARYPPVEHRAPFA